MNNLVGFSLCLMIVFLLALLSAPTMVLFVDITYLADPLSKEIAGNLFSGRFLAILSELVLVGIPPLVSGVIMLTILVMFIRKTPGPIQLVQIVLAQYLSLWMTIAALLHNPQEGFCINGGNGLLITKIYVDEACNPSVELVMLQIGWSVVFTIFIFGFSKVFRKIYIIYRGEK